ncbi:hypothetical protein QCA50_006111 [Cerrena zonata]|uniref:Carbohydrate-binding module family 13 protein n=1 Tax=Cerrena zonata TaxID=2478898 RepID=A0AAW0GLB6_9APHY
MTFIGHGIYYIQHAHVANVEMALANRGSAADGTRVIAWRSDEAGHDHMWLVEPVSKEADTYTIRNLLTGTYVDLHGSSSANGTPIEGWRKNDKDNQKWIIKKEESDGRRWKLQCKATGTFMDLLNGGGSGTPIQGWTGQWSDGTGPGHQHWLFQRISETSASILRSSSVIGVDFTSYQADGLYLIPTREQLSSILQNSKLTQMQWRDEIFDYDDFATVFKAEVAKWGNTSFKADGFAVLCGIMFGTKVNPETHKLENHAFNWTLDRGDNFGIIFLEPQNGQYSEDAWRYKAYFGFF